MLEILLSHLFVTSHKTNIDSVDPDNTLQNAASDQGLHYLPEIKDIYIKLVYNKMKSNNLPLETKTTRTKSEIWLY